MACSVSQFDKRFNSTCIDPDTKTKMGGGGWGRGVEGGKKTKREAGGRGRHVHDCSITLLCKYGRKRRRGKKGKKKKKKAHCGSQ